MFCKNCGKYIPDDAKFCPECGVETAFDPGSGITGTENENMKVPAVPEKPKSSRKKGSYARGGKITGEKVTENIYLCPDGKYRWFYELSMLKNPTILFTVWKVLGIAFGLVALFFLIMDLFEGTIRSLSDIWPALKTAVILVPVFLVISIIAYLIVAALYGWKYIVLFEMDDISVSHIPAPKHFEKAQAISLLTMLAGTLGKNRGAVSAGMLAGAKGPVTSVFRDVESVRVNRKRNTIHVDQMLDKNQVYAEDADFEFVESFIRERCIKAKIK